MRRCRVVARTSVCEARHKLCAASTRLAVRIFRQLGQGVLLPCLNLVQSMGWACMSCRWGVTHAAKAG